MNKVLVAVYIPFIQKKYEVFVPVGITVSKLRKLLLKAINELNDNIYDKRQAYLYDRETGVMYDNAKIIKNTSIRNSTEIILI